MKPYLQLTFKLPPNSGEGFFLYFTQTRDPIRASFSHHSQVSWIGNHSHISSTSSPAVERSVPVVLNTGTTTHIHTLL